VVYVKFLPDVACQKLLKSANALRSYSKNKSVTTFYGPRRSFEIREAFPKILKILYQRHMLTTTLA